VTVGKTLQFKVTAGFNDGSMKIVTTSATWSSSDSKIASIGSAGQSNPGLAAGVAPGNVNITASFSGVSAVTTLNVTGTGATLSSFFISQVNPTIAPGAKLQLFGYAEFSDGSVNGSRARQTGHLRIPLLRGFRTRARRLLDWLPHWLGLARQP